MANGAGAGLTDDELRELLTPTYPFGPSSTDELRRSWAMAIFDHNNDIERAVRKSAPVFLIGRRGSGKTAFLKAGLSDGELAVDLNSPELITQVGRTIQQLGLLSLGTFAELTSHIWNACFVAALCSRIWSPHCDLVAEDCPEAFAFGEQKKRPTDGRGTEVATRFLFELRKASLSDYASVTQLISDTKMNGVSFAAAYESLSVAAKRVDLDALVTLDSLDQYHNIYHASGILVTPEAFALQGLFRAAARTGRDPEAFFNVRVSFPAELWHYYSSLSSNPLKDFDNCVVLHWDNRELLQIAGHRLLTYIRLREPEEFRAIDVDGLRRLGDRRSSWAQRLLLRYLPYEVTNSIGVREPSLSYLLRHTQLLPRHLIYILNKIFAEVPLGPNCITESRIVRAVAEAEGEITSSVMDAFTIPYPNLEPVCEAIVSQLELTFMEPELHNVVNHANRYGMEYHEILRMFIEAGVVGRVTERGGPYIHGDFEYLHLNRMLLTEEDELCLHPLFARRFDSKALKHPVRKGLLPIRPLGADPTRQEFTRFVLLN